MCRAKRGCKSSFELYIKITLTLMISLLMVNLDLRTFVLIYLLHREKFPGGLQVGGGINTSNALSYIDKGASHVIVTSVRLLSVYFNEVDFCWP